MGNIQTEFKKTKRRANMSLAGGIIMIGLVFGSYVVLSLFIEGIMTHLNAGILEVVALFSVAGITQAVAPFVLSTIINKVSVKLLTGIGAFCFVIFFVLMAVGNSLFLLYLGAIFFGVSTTLCGFAVIQPVITWWHAKNLGKKIGFLSIAYCVAAMLLSFLIPQILLEAGFQITVLLMGIIFGIVLLIISIFMISNRPDTYGLKPYGYEESAEEQTETNIGSTGLTIKEILKTGSFWLFMIIGFLLMIASTGFTNNAGIIYQSMGLDLATAGVIMTAMYGINIFWNFFYGALSDKKGGRTSSIIFGLITIVAFILGSFLTGFGGAIVIAIVIGAFNYGGMFVPLNAGPLFGTRAIGTVITLCIVAQSLGNIVAPLVAGGIYAFTGSYSKFMLVAAIIMVVVVILTHLSTSKAAIVKIKNRQSNIAK
jgi:sugar phosphate permease